MIHQLRQKLAKLVLPSYKSNLFFQQAHKIQFQFSNAAKNTNEGSFLDSKVDFKSLTKVEIAQYLRYVSQQCSLMDKGQKGLANRLNNIEQQAVSHLSLNTDDLTTLSLILQIMLQNQRQSQNIYTVAHSILLEYFSNKIDLQSLTQEQLDKRVSVFQQIIPLVSQSDRFEYQLLNNMNDFFSNEIVFSKFTQTSQLHILKIFFSKGIARIPSGIKIDTQQLPFQDLVEYLWMQSLAKQPIEESTLTLLSNQLQAQPSLKNIPKPIQYKLKEISISENLREAAKYISLLDDYYTRETDSSSIQEDCEIILRVLKWNYKQEVLIDPYTVDFVVDIPHLKNKVVLEMNGPSHYPYSSKKDILSGKDQMKVKNLLLKQYYPVLLHHQEWSAIKGVTGKMDFIRTNVEKQTKNYI